MRLNIKEKLQSPEIMQDPTPCNTIINNKSKLLIISTKDSTIDAYRNFKTDSKYINKMEGTFGNLILNKCGRINKTPKDVVRSKRYSENLPRLPKLTFNIKTIRIQFKVFSSIKTPAW